MIPALRDLLPKWAIALALAAATSPAAAQTLRFADTAPGSIRATGNTLGLSKALDENGPGLEDSIGTFITLGNGVDDDPASPDNPWPPGTTNDWKANGSSAVLDLPPEAEVLYAELLWGGSHKYPPEDVTASLDSPVTIAAGGADLMVAPDPATALTIDELANTGFQASYYLRSADVTAFVKAAGPGTYSVSGVPATQTTTINSLNAAGWTLVVAYRHQKEPTRNLSIFVGGSFVDEDSQQDYAIAGFCAPPAGEVAGTVVSSTIEGDADLTGDQLLIAPTALGPFAALSGPNNPKSNFFCSQINDHTGQLDTKGTFGTANHDAKAGTNVVGGRQGWDVTTVPLSSKAGQLVNGQTSAVIRAATMGDSFVPVLAAFAIDVNAPDFTPNAGDMESTADVVTLGDTFTVTATITNQGEVTAESLVLTLPLPAGLALAWFEMDGSPGDLDGNPVDAAALGAGVAAGALAAGQTRSVKLGLEVLGPPPSLSYFLEATWAYAFEVCQGDPPLPESFSQFATIAYDAPEWAASTGAGGTPSGQGGATSGAGGGAPSGGDGGTSTGSGQGGTASGGEQGGAAGAGGEGGAASTTGTMAASGDAADDEGGCACRASKRSSPGLSGLFGAAVAAALLVRRRARRAPPA